MIDFNQPINYEHTNFYHKDFPFATFKLYNIVTLPHWHNHMELVYAKKGSVDVYINGTLYHCNEKSLLIIPCNSLHSIIPEYKSTYVAIVIGDNLLQELKKDSHLSKILNIYNKINNPSLFYFSKDNNIYHEIIEPIKKTMKENDNRNTHYKIFIKIYLCDFFTVLYRYMPEVFSNTEIFQTIQTKYIKTSIEYLVENYCDKITLDSMCQIVNLSKQHFSRLFKSYTGKTFIEYLTLFRLEQAEKLLLQTNIPVTQIPELTGFCNANYFSRVYKKNYNQTPSKTRKNRNNKQINT
ncbi:MAG: helix-turn-helix domain-containing protein [Lachnospirales bacterium]